jgi:hypothetical protein
MARARWPEHAEFVAMQKKPRDFFLRVWPGDASPQLRIVLQQASGSGRFGAHRQLSLGYDMPNVRHDKRSAWEL